MKNTSINKESGDVVVSIIKALKPNQVYLYGGMLIVAGISGSSSPWWFPLVNDWLRAYSNLVTRSDAYTASSATLVMSVIFLLLGVGLIVMQGIFDYKTQQSSKPSAEVIQFKQKIIPIIEKAAFEADDNSSIIITEGIVKGYEHVAKATKSSVVSFKRTKVEKE